MYPRVSFIIIFGQINDFGRNSKSDMLSINCVGQSSSRIFYWPPFTVNSSHIYNFIGLWQIIVPFASVVHKLYRLFFGCWYWRSQNILAIKWLNGTSASNENIAVFIHSLLMVLWADQLCIFAFQDSSSENLFNIVAPSGSKPHPFNACHRRCRYESCAQSHFRILISALLMRFYILFIACHHNFSLWIASDV